MKTVLVVCEGAADAPRPELEGRTPLQVARCANAERLAREGRSGWMPLPDQPDEQRSEALLALLCGATRPEALQLHRGPLEAAALELETKGYTHAYRGNFVTLDGTQVRESCVGRLSLEETQLLAATVQERFDPAVLRLVPCGPAQVVALLRSEHDPISPGVHPALTDGDLDLYLPQGRKGEWARKVLDESGRVLARLTVNEVRVDLGENPATHLWLWGGGRFYTPGPRMGALLTNSRLARGLARVLQLEGLALRDPWSDDPAVALANAELVAQALERHDRLVLYVEAPREASDYGTPAEKVRLLERFDLTLLGPLVKQLEQVAPARLILTADNNLGPAGVEPAARVPVAVWRQGVQLEGALRWDEQACRSGALGRLAPEDVHALLRGDI
jgi:2,3-bisphosphoglycerate-independent phosphoglycerate mutase